MIREKMPPLGEFGPIPTVEMKKNSQDETQPSPVDSESTVRPDVFSLSMQEIPVSPENLRMLKNKLKEIIDKNNGKDPFDEECYGNLSDTGNRRIEELIKLLKKQAKPEEIKKTQAELLDFIGIEKTNAQNIKNFLIKIINAQRKAKLEMAIESYNLRRQIRLQNYPEFKCLLEYDLSV